jgi:hypothetical protein
MNRVEEQVRAATQAQAAVLREVRPLRLPESPDGLARARGSMRPRRGWGRGGWLVPAVAAVTVVVIAGALVIVKAARSGHEAPAPIGPVAPIPGVPEYYVTLNWVPSYGAGTGLLVGDTFAGQTIAVIPPPARARFEAVTGAADDRTFAALAYPTGSRHSYGTWYLITLAPGTAHPARLTRLPAKPLGLFDESAISASGKELAVVTTDGSSLAKRILAVYSTVTGRLLRSWSTSDWLLVPPTGGNDVAFRWTDDDRAITFPAARAAAPPGGGAGYEPVIYRLDLAAPGTDLAAGSRVIWSASAPSTSASDGGPVTCGHGIVYPMVTADGKTGQCALASAPPGRAIIYAPHPTWPPVTPGTQAPAATAPAAASATASGAPPATSSAAPAATGAWRATWRSYPLGARVGAGTAGTVDYQTDIDVPQYSGVDVATLWTSASGAELLGAWTVFSQEVRSPPFRLGQGAGPGQGGSAPQPEVHFGLISHGTFTPLPTPRGSSSLDSWNYAW